MTGNEILLNMENWEYFRPTEITGSLLALAKIPEQTKFDWEVHPYTLCVIQKLVELMPTFKKEHLMQAAIIFDRLRIKSQSISSRILSRVLGQIGGAFAQSISQVNSIGLL